MRALIHPAIDALERQINKDEFPATRYALDWYFHPDSDTSVDAPPMRITVTFDRANQDDETTPTLALNGHTTT